MSDLDLDLDRLEALAKAASPLPWDGPAYNKIISVPLSDEHMRAERVIDALPAIPDDGDPIWDTLPVTFVCGVPVCGGDTPTAQGFYDARFIIAAANAVGPLLTEIRTLRTANANHLEARHRLITELTAATFEAKRASDRVDALEAEVATLRRDNERLRDLEREMSR